MRDYHGLEVWRRAHQLTLRVYQFTSEFPPDERFGLTAQTRRASVGAVANIVEGSGRPTRADYARFLGIAAASLHELHSHLELALDLGFGTQHTGRTLLRETAEIRAMVTTLRSRVDPPNRRGAPLAED